MTTTVLKNIPGRDLPPRWVDDINENLDQTFTVFIQPEGRIPKTRRDSSASRRNRILKMLEGNSGNESSEKWIELIKSARTISTGKAVFE